ncbi:MaoC family dehydratase [Novosphingopyxis iocasae]|uniref:MaoC family dehydratase n=1 Tax=Novosphingopyxis iocasae TaxID=2762729 RepID=UPI0016514E8B|nr:MaoC family dehydratase [Novosphingopyxis iocasae]|tara:strand:- start:456 stop:914 length:459 start_codon:yes stop_codon:yes gene_type:complete
MQFYEDLIVGSQRKFGRYEVTREEVLQFATAYDPQPFHLDDAAAAETYFGKLSASGWHTCAMTMRMMVDSWEDEAQASLGSPGIDELRWLRPVYPGDVLRVESELIEKRRSASRPEMGITKTRQTTFNQKDEPVLSMVANGLIRVRDPEAND